MQLKDPNHRFAALSPRIRGEKLVVGTTKASYAAVLFIIFPKVDLLGNGMQT